MTRRAWRWTWVLAITLPSAGWGEPRPVDFNRDVRPILSDRCYACHGFDEKKREADLRLDTFEGATADRDSGAPIVPGHPEQSLILQRIVSTDPDLKMPPPDSNKIPLSAEEIKTLERWIQEGAEYRKHWSFLPIDRPAVPPGSEPHPIDRFVSTALRERSGPGLSPAARPERLLRRVSFDLTGLPPTPAQLDEFLRDPSPSAYERAVDRLLDSPAFGERLASEWLDVARFADTHGYQMDRDRPVWPYRDWVIRAFNANLPYSDFVRWQLAGDLLEKPTKEQRLATTFNRLHNQNEEGGIVEEEFRVAYVVDRVTTFGTVFLGLTLECSRCHDHKYDPISAKEFYSLFAFFQNIAEPGQTSYFTPDMPTPAMMLSTDEQDARLAELDRQLAEKERLLAESVDEAGFVQWLQQGRGEPKIPGKLAEYRFDSMEGGKIPNEVDPAKPGQSVDDAKLTEGPPGHGQAGRLSGDNGFDFPGVGHFHRAQPFSLAIWLRPSAPSPRGVVVHHSKAPADAASRGYDLLLEEGHVSFGLYYMWPGSAIKVQTKETLAPQTWTHVVATYDGSGKAAGLSLYLNGRRADTTTLRDYLTKDITYGDEPNLAIGYRFRDNGFRDGAVDDFAVFDRELTELEAAHLAGGQELIQALSLPDPTGPIRDQLADYYLRTTSPVWKQQADELRALRDQRRKLLAPIPELMVMEELPSPKPAFLLQRGNYDQPGDAVAPNTPAVLPPFREDRPRNRLGLADWLLDASNPLMARVTVNRYWQMLFGRGLVETSDNFGLQGASPTHPELLDWLARDFIENGWDLKRFLKQIVLSQTYQQQSSPPEWARQNDVDNRWLAHAPARVLTAEMLRDQALAVSGLLHPALGGPSVKPYQPAGLWAIAMGNPTYDQSHGENLYRRSLYTYWKKTVPPPSMMTLDAADRSYCTVRRQSTNTPLQSLVLLNDPQFVEAARQLGERMLREGGSETSDRLRWVFRVATSRWPTEAELAILSSTFDEQKQLFASTADSAKKLLGVGEKKANDDLDPVEWAAATVVAQTVLNHDEAVRRR
jgi:hypothetical protein